MPLARNIRPINFSTFIPIPHRKTKMTDWEAINLNLIGIFPLCQPTILLRYLYIHFLDHNVSEPKFSETIEYSTKPNLTQHEKKDINSLKNNETILIAK